MGDAYTNKSVRTMFNDVPATYQSINFILTGGLDRYWRRTALNLALQAGGTRWLDMCTGTGDMSRSLAARAGSGVQVFGADFNLPMITEAKRQAPAIPYLLADVHQLPVADNTFDLATVSFAIRNLNTSREELTAAFRELHRVLVPGSALVIVETSQPRSVLVRKLYHLFVRLFVKRVGTFISGSPQAYTYLSYTIPRFYTAEEQAAVLKEAGFSTVSVTRITFGAAAVHRAIK